MTHDQVKSLKLNKNKTPLFSEWGFINYCFNLLPDQFPPHPERSRRTGGGGG